jgi:hypothetical protein
MQLNSSISGNQALAAENRSRGPSGKKWSSMKISNVLKSLLVTSALLMAVNAFASNKGALQLGSMVTINGKQLPAGEYAVKWEGNGPDVKVTIMKGKNVMITMPARLVDLKNSPNSDAAVIKKNDDGSSSLSQIRFGGRKYALALDGMNSPTS